MVRGDSDKKMSKNTEKVVANLRIKQIETGIRSISSILDTRTLFDLDPVDRKDMDATREKEKVQKRLNTRRGNNLSQTNLLNQGVMAVDMLKAKGVSLEKTTEEYGDEERIWRHKYRTPTYTQKRRFDNPKLQEYFNSLNPEEQRQFKIECRQTLYELSSGLRAQMTAAKKDMDNKGVFHPTANAHRAHCMYLLKVYKDVGAEKIEDPVLKKMKKESVDWDNSGTEDSKRLRAASYAPVSRPTTSSSSKVRQALNPRQFERVAEKKKPLQALLTAPSIPNQTTTQRSDSVSISVSSDTRSGPGRLSRHNTSDSPLKPTTKETSMSRQNSRNRMQQAMQTSTPKVTVTGRHNRPGTGTAVEAGLGMDGFVEGCSSDWMIMRLQKDQIDSALTAPDNPMSTPMHRPDSPLWKNIPELSNDERPRTAGFNAEQPIISFVEFQELFYQYAKEAEEEAAKSNLQTNGTSEGDNTGSKSNKSPRGDGAPLPPVQVKTGTGGTKSTTPQNKDKGSRRRRSFGLSKKPSAENTFLGALSDPASQKIMASMQPHVDAFVAVRTKKKHSIDQVNKMMASRPKVAQTKVEMSVGPNYDSDKGKKIVSNVGLKAVRSQTAKVAVPGTTLTPAKKRRGPEGFRNVFADDDASSVAVDDRSASVSAIESRASVSELESDDDDTSSEDEDPLTGTPGKGRGSKFSPGTGPRQSFLQKGRLGKLKKGPTKTEDAQQMLEKQMAVWDALQVTTADRIAIMNKYSSEEYAPYFNDAVHLWSLVAVLVLFRIEMKKMYMNYQRGLLEIPDGGVDDFFFRYALDKIPTQLRRNYNPDNQGRSKRRSGPDALILNLFDEVRSFLTNDSEEIELENMPTHDILLFLHGASKRLDQRLLKTLDEAEEKFFDVVPFGIISCKEWLANKAQRFPVPKN
mmetsp:Transcript_20387/g.29279  ORF Transcript_20387/g.29279 Transcript_20387/m.29279 type:complete len:913 (-) Transcript_20387:71-2809(-)